jgi:hypothetical protein
MAAACRRRAGACQWTRNLKARSVARRHGRGGITDDMSRSDSAADDRLGANDHHDDYLEKPFTLPDDWRTKPFGLRAVRQDRGDASVGLAAAHAREARWERREML